MSLQNKLIMKRNYHTHHHLCGHATGNAEEYVKEAIKRHFDILGFSDHAPNPQVHDFGVRMEMKDLPAYIKDVNTAKAKYADKIKIYSGLEVEYFDEHEEYFLELRQKVDYLIHGQHYISMMNTMNTLISGFALTKPDQLLKYAEYLEKAMKSEHFSMLAHPDLYMCGYKNFDETATIVAHRICKMASENDVVLEFNANGFRRATIQTPQGATQPYPRVEFWKIAKSYNCLTIFNSDCHTPEFLYDRVVRKAEEVYNSLELNDVGKLKLIK